MAKAQGVVNNILKYRCIPFQQIRPLFALLLVGTGCDDHHIRAFYIRILPGDHLGWRDEADPMVDVHGIAFCLSFIDINQHNFRHQLVEHQSIYDG